MTGASLASKEISRASAQLARDLRAVQIDVVYDTAEAVKIIESFPEWDNIALDVETDAASEEAKAMKFDARTSWLRTMQFAADRQGTFGLEERCWVFDIKDMDRASLAEALRRVGKHYPHGLLPVFVYNASFEDVVVGIQLGGKTGQQFEHLIHCEDLMLYEASLRLGANGNDWYASLAEVSEQVLGIVLEGKGTLQLSYDKVTPLTRDQIRYAADDAIVTLWLRRELTEELHAADLYEVATELVNGSRPVWQGLRVYGLPLHTGGWARQIEKSQRTCAELLTKLALMTGGGQGDLFADHLTPTFKPGSSDQVKATLNTYEPERVKDYIAEYVDPGNRRLFGKSDSADAGALQLMGGELAATISLWNKEDKIITSFGQKLINGVEDDGRLHSEFTQNLVDTGRASSRGTLNLQAFTPRLKPFMRPEPRLWGALPTCGWVPRIFVAGDFSQAELRVLAQLSGEPVMIEAFAKGIDQHESTAAAMFQQDMRWLHSLADGDTEAYERYTTEMTQNNAVVLPMEEAKEWAKKVYDSYRQLAKPLNFGIPYGMRAGLLASNLTKGGTPTTKDQAQELLDKYYAAMTRNAAWLNSRDAAVKVITDALQARALNPSNPDGQAVPELDFKATWKLHLLHSKIASASQVLRKRLGHRPDAEEICEHMYAKDSLTGELTERLGRAPSSEEVDDEFSRRLEAVAWARGYMASTILCKDGTPFSFESRTAGNRRRLFQCSTQSWVSAMAMTAATSRKPRAIQVRSDWEKHAGVKLTATDTRGNLVPLNRAMLGKVFEDKALKLDFVSFVLQNMQRQQTT